MLLNLPERLGTLRWWVALTLGEKYLTKKDQKLWTASFEFQTCAPNYFGTASIREGGGDGCFGTELP